MHISYTLFELVFFFMPLSRKRKQAWTLLAFVLVGLGLFWLWGQVVADEFGERQLQIVQRYADERPLYAMGLFTSFAFLSVLLGPLSSAPVVPFAIVLWGKVVTFFLMLIGWMLGAIVSYGVGMYAGYPLVAHVLGKRRLDDWLRRISRQATFVLALMFRLALPAETGYVFGLIRYPFLSFLAVSLIVEIPVGLGLIFVGDAFVTQNLPLLISLMVLGFGVLGTALVVLRDRLALEEK